ncbi:MULTISPECIES: DUF2974 domain-containing protein [unclassified Streptococcus]|uniref:DUF2974 domain-containing protein n=1 Tax=unclassified Streptococcus TaxID=2608887 RepID=UPI0010716934|nr:MULTISPECIES: DUF2974 domain-containing protein [unclassified Streptococcus]MBF0787192.1 DUF2974 domain-containing protein [Streptococcus sp. 19428wC2_LYSM12]MCQ9212093.1 DUF2974 domain-containing protein [Streptococcus sp. B01]MCQ9213422.1 DUF2974 domain-containing protein [Streptococcus sp. O1]TFV05941.1 DUF2974 domain-containing protein [Streptococcus sp. LYSM12]
MPNLLQYIEEVAYYNFYDLPLNRLDILALTEISYLPFNELVTSDFTTANTLRLDHLAEQFEATYQKRDTPNLSVTVTPNRLQLLQLLKETKRFKAIKAFAYVDDYDKKEEKQFAAITYKIGQDKLVTIFRGTDDTIIGWKEDFHMTYMVEIPAQQSATEYLKNIMDISNQTLYVAGHSKGGNLAIYASSQMNTKDQERITQIIAYDSPGVHSSVITSSGYLAIKNRIQSIIPQNSIVGMLLETPEHAEIVESKAFGLLQHISFTWEIEGHDFKLAPALTENSVQIDETLKTWTANLNDEELKRFFDLLFGIFIDAGIERLDDFTIDTPKKISLLMQQQQNLTEQEKDILDTLFRRLIDTRYQVWKDALTSPYATLAKWFKKKTGRK